MITFLLQPAGLDGALGSAASRLYCWCQTESHVSDGSRLHSPVYRCCVRFFNLTFFFLLHQTARVIILIWVHACDDLLDELFGLQVFAVFSLVARITEPPPDANHKTKRNECFECSLRLLLSFLHC